LSIFNSFRSKCNLIKVERLIIKHVTLSFIPVQQIYRSHKPLRQLTIYKSSLYSITLALNLSKCNPLHFITPNKNGTHPKSTSKQAIALQFSASNATKKVKTLKLKFWKTIRKPQGFFQSYDHNPVTIIKSRVKNKRTQLFKSQNSKPTSPLTPKITLKKGGKCKYSHSLLLKNPHSSRFNSLLSRSRSCILDLFFIPSKFCIKLLDLLIYCFTSLINLTFFIIKLKTRVRNLTKSNTKIQVQNFLENTQTENSRKSYPIWWILNWRWWFFIFFYTKNSLHVSRNKHNDQVLERENWEREKQRDFLVFEEVKTVAFGSVFLLRVKGSFLELAMRVLFDGYGFYLIYDVAFFGWLDWFFRSNGNMPCNETSFCNW